MTKELGQLVETLVDPKGFIVVNRTMIERFGPLEAIILGELIGESNYWRREKKLEDGFFFSTVENLEKNTFIKRKQQERIIKDLISTGVIEMKIKDSPPKRYFRINYEIYSSILLDEDFQYGPQSRIDTDAGAVLIRTPHPSNKNNTITITNNNKKKLFKNFSTKNFNSFYDKYLVAVTSIEGFIRKNYYNISTFLPMSTKQNENLDKILSDLTEEQVEYLFEVDLISFIQQEVIQGKLFNKKTNNNVGINFSTIYNNLFGIKRQLKFNGTKVLSDDELIVKKEMFADYIQDEEPNFFGLPEGFEEVM